MKRRSAIQTILGLPAAAALPAPAQEQKAPAAMKETPLIPAVTADAAADPQDRFFSAGQFAALRRLADLLVPPRGDMPGAKSVQAAEWIDFLVSASSPERQALYRGGLDRLDAEARRRSGKVFAETSPEEAAPLLAPLAEKWTYHEPADPFARFLRTAKQDVLTATFNSREWSEAASKRSRRAGGLGLYWYPIE